MLDLTKTYDSKNYGQFKITRYVDYRHVHIEFLATGTVSVVQAGAVRGGGVRDVMFPSVHSVGFFGSGKWKASANGKITKAYTAWEGMLERCYDHRYQAKKPTYVGCTVCKEWHDFQVFATWFESHHVEGYDLDKDKLVAGNRIYSPDTCCFISHQENAEVSLAKSFSLIDPKGNLVEGFNLRRFCRDNGLNQGSMNAVKLGKRNHHHGWTRA